MTDIYSKLLLIDTARVFIARERAKQVQTERSLNT